MLEKVKIKITGESSTCWARYNRILNKPSVVDRIKGSLDKVLGASGLILCGSCDSVCKKTAKGHQSTCVECNREKQAARSKKHYEANKKDYVDNAARWKAENKDKVAEGDMKYRMTDAAKKLAKERNRRWRKKNPEKAREKAATYLANKRALSGHCSIGEWKMRLAYYGGKCFYCGTEGNIEREHRIPVSRGGTNWPSNLVPACRSCNAKKHAKTESEYVELLRKRSK